MSQPIGDTKTSRWTSLSFAVDSRFSKYCAAILMLTLVGCGLQNASDYLPIPSHIHNDAKAKTAHAAQDAMNDYIKGSPAMYATMTSNAQLFQSQEDQLLSATHSFRQNP